MKTNRDIYTNDALMNISIAPVIPQAKEGLAIVNGTLVSVVVAVLVLHDAHQTCSSFVSQDHNVC